MTIQATRQVLFDGPRRAVMLFTGVCDGNGGDEVNEKKVVVADLTPPCHHANIEKVEYEVSGGIVRILWGAPDPVTFLDLAQQGEIDYKEIGGAINPTSADTPNDIWFTTSVLTWDRAIRSRSPCARRACRSRQLYRSGSCLMGYKTWPPRFLLRGGAKSPHGSFGRKDIPDVAVRAGGGAFGDGQLGAELTLTGDFGADANWTKDAGWAIAAGVATATATAHQCLSASGHHSHLGADVQGGIHHHRLYIRECRGVVRCRADRHRLCRNRHLHRLSDCWRGRC
jgi:hypothetical protein